MSLYPLQLLTYSSHYRNLKPFSIPPPSLTMKDRPLSSCGAVYVPPHQRLRSVITVPSAVSPQPGSFRPTAIDQKPNPNSLKSYACLPPQQQPVRLQHKRSSQFDEVSEEGGDIELTPYQVGETRLSVAFWSLINVRILCFPLGMHYIGTQLKCLNEQRISIRWRE